MRSPVHLLHSLIICLYGRIILCMVTTPAMTSAAALIHIHVMPQKSSLYEARTSAKLSRKRDIQNETLQHVRHTASWSGSSAPRWSSGPAEQSWASWPHAPGSSYGAADQRHSD